MLGLEHFVFFFPLSFFVVLLFSFVPLVFFLQIFYFLISIQIYFRILILI